MGFRIRKSISLGKGIRLNLGKNGITSVSFGKRGTPHVTVGKNGTRFGTPVIPGTGISYETRLDKPSRETESQRPVMNRRPIHPATPMRPMPAVNPRQTQVLTPVSVIPPSPVPPMPNGYAGGNGNRGSHKMKKPWYGRWWAILLYVFLAFILLCIVAYATTPNGEIPDMTGQTVAAAKTELNNAGFDNITVKPETKGGDDKWKVESQNPISGEFKTSTPITLTVKRDNSDLADIAKKDMRLDAVITALKHAGYSSSDYVIESDTGKTVDKPSDWIVLSAGDGVIKVHDKAAEEAKAKSEAKAEAAKKKAEEAAKKAEEAAKKAEEEKAAKEQAEQQRAAEEEASRQAQLQAEQQQQVQQQQQQQQQTTSPSDNGSGSLIAICSDGTQAASAPGAPNYRGMCSGHGGIAQKLGRQ
ncbi:DUF4236 domain-containing protein [Bifidobacterium sp. 82T25]|nr:DUF4236 domain-containing protein [Bifidobacterium miconisargentati]